MQVKPWFSHDVGKDFRKRENGGEKYYHEVGKGGKSEMVLCKWSCWKNSLWKLFCAQTFFKLNTANNSTFIQPFPIYIFQYQGDDWVYYTQLRFRHDDYPHALTVTFSPILFYIDKMYSLPYFVDNTLILFSSCESLHRVSFAHACLGVSISSFPTPLHLL